MDTEAEVGATQVSNITSGSSQAYAPMLREVSKKKPAYTRKRVSVVDRPTELRLEAAETSTSNDVSAEKIEHQYKRRKGDTSTPREVMRTVAQAQLQATFYPKFENEMPDREVIVRMQEVVGTGHGVLEESIGSTSRSYREANNYRWRSTSVSPSSSSTRGIRSTTSATRSASFFSTST